jgi:hypothetical protein
MSFIALHIDIVFWSICLVKDVIVTYKEIVKPHPTIWPFNKASPYPFVLHPKPKWKHYDDVWFMTTPIGHNQLW